MSGAGRLVVALAIAAAVFGVASAVQASIPDSNGVAHACYYVPGKLSSTPPRPGALRVIDTAKPQVCASDEKPIDLATTQYVQSQVQHTQFIYTDPAPLSFPGTGIAYIYWVCPAGWVATNATVNIKAGQPENTIVQIDGANMGSVQNSATNPYGADGQWLMHMTYTQANVQFYAQLQCVQAQQVYGNAFGAAPTNGAGVPSTPTMHVDFKPST